MMACLSVLLSLTLAGVALGADFLPPDVAFRPTARMADSNTLVVRFAIADGYYMYRDRFAVASATGDTELAPPLLPSGHVKFDENFQREVETYRGEVDVRIPLGNTPRPLRLVVTSQGCADAGLCYPPQSSTFEVAAPPPGAVPTVVRLDREGDAAVSLKPAEAVASTGSDAPSSGDDGMTAVLRGGGVWAVVGAFLVAGLLLSFTPCVLPMLPILSAIVVGGAPVSRSRGLGLAAAYSLGMAVVYTLLGMAAGLAGEGLAAALQAPSIQLAFAGALVLLALSSLGLYELQVPARWQGAVSNWAGRLPGGRAGPVFVMGGVSALLVGPCVAAPLAAALLYISQSRDVVLGGLALFSLAVGMSVPLLLLGASAGAWLPKAGAWMQSVRRAVGVLTLALAIWVATPAVPTWLSMLAWAVLLVGAGVALRPWERVPHGSGNARWLAKGLGLLLVVVGLAEAVGVLSGGRNPLQPLAHLGRSPAEQSAGPRFQPVRNLAELDSALAATTRPVMLDFYAEWCVSCKEMEAFTYRDPAVQAKLAGMTLLKADVTANNADDRALLRRFQLFGPPATLFFDAQGRQIDGVGVMGFQDARRFLQTLGKAGV